VRVAEHVMIPDQVLPRLAPGQQRLPASGAPTSVVLPGVGPATTMADLLTLISARPLQLSPADLVRHNAVLPVTDPAALGDASQQALRILPGAALPAEGGRALPAWASRMLAPIPGIDENRATPSHAVARLLGWPALPGDALRALFQPAHFTTNL